MTRTRLEIELVPSTCWFSNVRSEVSSADWDRLKKLTFKAAGYRCEVCGGRGPKWPVECHEIWHYSERPETPNIRAMRVQKLVGLIALCPACHEVKHIGLAETRGRIKEATQHLAKVNGWSYEDAQVYVVFAFEQWAQRSQYEWSLDISYLEQLNIRIGSQDGKAPDCKSGNAGVRFSPGAPTSEPLPF